MGHPSDPVETPVPHPIRQGSDLDGAVAELDALRILPFAYSRFPVLLRSGQQIQYDIEGSTGTGSIIMTIVYRPAVTGSAGSLA